ncbi:hypothetical protein VTK73DRAFT_7899 [Phialemonium thermophilum]|uniref:Uncharacterized protein n=1 Tax=Phialemonium thermophilum TaxID=223376 RepID=A0ABR3WCD4_9PEZI
MFPVSTATKAQPNSVGKKTDRSRKFYNVNEWYPVTDQIQARFRRPARLLMLTQPIPGHSNTDERLQHDPNPTPRRYPSFHPMLPIFSTPTGPQAGPS